LLTNDEILENEIFYMDLSEFKCRPANFRRPLKLKRDKGV